MSKKNGLKTQGTKGWLAWKFREVSGLISCGVSLLKWVNQTPARWEIDVSMHLFKCGVKAKTGSGIRNLGEGVTRCNGSWRRP